MIIRDATGIDAGVCAGIYAPYVRDTAISFEEVPPAPEQMEERIALAQKSHAWLVAEIDGTVVGYAYGGPFAKRPAYRWSCESSIYLDRGCRGGGIGRTLYTALLDRLAQRGYRCVLAGMTLPNDASAGLHRVMGFEPVALYRNIGFKNGAWHDVQWLQRDLAAAPNAPAEPV